MLTVSLVGPFRVTDESGQDFAPKGAKARALLAILALSKEKRRSRVWLRGRLWSTSGPSQGADSLRQSLTELRKALGPYAAALVTDRRSVSLASDLVDVQLPNVGDDQNVELCEDVDVSDPAYLEWLANVRDRFRTANGSAPALIELQPDTSIPVVVFSLAHAVPEDVLWVFQTLRESISVLLGEGGSINVVNERDDLPNLSTGKRPYFFVVFDVNSVPGQAVVSMRLECGNDGRTIWSSGQKWLSNDGGDETIWELNKLAYHAHEETSSALAASHGELSGANSALALAALGRKRLFEYSKESLMDADRLFSAAYQVEPHGAFLAWRCFLRNTATIEHLSDSFLDPVNRSDLIEQAIMDNSTSSFVLAVASQDAMARQNDVKLAKALVLDALDRNTANPLGIGILSNLQSLEGEADASLHSAKRAQSLVDNQSYRGFWSAFVCLSYMAKGDYEQAAFQANMGHYLAPRFLAAQRLLYVANVALGRESQAMTILQKIRKREPEFSKHHLFRNDYPNRTLRVTGILDHIENSK